MSTAYYTKHCALQSPKASCYLHSAAGPLQVHTDTGIPACVNHILFPCCTCGSGFFSSCPYHATAFARYGLMFLDEHTVIAAFLSFTIWGRTVW